MSSIIHSQFAFYLQQVSIYAGLSILVAGLFGETLNIIVFLSLQTFRQNSCAFYLIIMSFVNIGQLLTGLLFNILITGYEIDLTSNSVFYCKFRQYCRQVCALVSLTCFSLTTIDQYLATCSRPRWQQISNIRVARRLSAATSLHWILQGIPCLIYFNLIPSATTAGQLIFTMTNKRFAQYFLYGYVAIFTGYLPVSISAVFGSLAYYNVRRLAYRTVPLVRRELDKQLNIMVLNLNIYNIVALMPYPVILTLTSLTTIAQDPSVAAKIDFVGSLTTYSYYSYYACSFYIYICTSERFRRQLVHVLFKVHLERWRRHKIVPALALPQE